MKALRTPRGGAPAHLARVTAMAADGTLTLGGAIVDEGGAMRGSIVVTRHATDADARAWMAADPYMTGGVAGHHAARHALRATAISGAAGRRRERPSPMRAALEAAARIPWALYGFLRLLPWPCHVFHRRAAGVPTLPAWAR